LNLDGIFAAYCDIRRSSLDIGDGVHITTPPGKAVALLGLGNQINHCLGSIGKIPLSRSGCITSSSAGDGEDTLRRWHRKYQIPFGKLDFPARGDLTPTV